MAPHILRIAAGMRGVFMKPSLNSHTSKQILSPKRYATTTVTGAFREHPPQTPLGLLKVVLTVIPGLYIGAALSRMGAAWLEENDIFVPDDDDDD